MVDATEFRRGRDEAGAALGQARLASEAGAQNWAAFLSEQAAQLAAKALLHGLGRGARGHDLVELGERLAEIGLLVPDDDRDALARLSRHYQGARYPDTLPAGSPSERYTRRDGEQALEDAERIIELVDEGWRALGR